MKSLTTILIIQFFLASLFAQNENEKLKEVFWDAEYFMMNEDYTEALSNYTKIYSNGYQDNGNVNYKIGQCYLKIAGAKEKAIPYLEKAVQYCNPKYQENNFKEQHTPYDAYFYLGTAYRINHQFEKAISCFRQFKSYYELSNPERVSVANKEIEASNYAQSQIQKRENIYSVKLNRPVSSGSSDIFPVVSGDLSTLIYVTTQKLYDAVFCSKKINNRWSAPLNITSEIQSDGDQYPTFISYDGTELYLRKEDNFEADLMVSKKINGQWTKSKSVGKNINSRYWEGNMSISADGKTLYFSSNRKEGLGSLDIYKSTRESNGEWGTPVNIGSNINTAYNDDAPYITEDGKRLYFISQGHNSMGGYDIFYCDLQPNGLLSEAVHLDYPISTADDDLYFYPLKNGSIYYSANCDKEITGKEDIYEVYIHPSSETIASLNSREENNLPQVLMATTDDSEIKQIARSEEEKIANTENDNLIILPTSFFETNSYELTKNGKKSLEYLKKLADEFNNVNIEVITNSNNTESGETGNSLTDKRAESARSFLIQNGVLQQSVSAKGAGEKIIITIYENVKDQTTSSSIKQNKKFEVLIIENERSTKIVIEKIDMP